MMQYPPIVKEVEKGVYSFNVDQAEMDSMLPVVEEILTLLESGREFLNPTVKTLSLANLLVSYAAAYFNNIQEDEENSKEDIMKSLFALLWDYCHQSGDNCVAKCLE